MGDSVWKINELYNLGSYDNRFIENCIRKNIIGKSNIDDKICYKVSNMYNALEPYIISNRERWYSLKKEFRNEVEEWYFNEYANYKLNEIEQGNEGKYLALPIERALKEIELINNNNFYLFECNCRVMNHNCDKPVSVCINYSGIDFDIDDPNARMKKISKEEAKKILIETDEAGLVHFFEGKHICNCCNCCCYPMRLLIKEGFKDNYPQIEYNAVIDSEKCVSCGKCIDRCPMNTITKDKEHICIRTDKCIGCGLCESKCPVGAITMINI